MKTKLIIIITISALTTLSFTFASVKTEKKAKVEIATQSIYSEPIGGFISEDKL